MSNLDNHNIPVENVSLRSLVRSIFRHWVLILILMLGGGAITGVLHFFMKPLYTATTIVSIDPDLLFGNYSPAFVISSDSIKEKVAEKFNIEVAKLPQVTVTTDKTDKSISKVALSSKNAKLAVQMVNYWSETAVAAIIEDTRSVTSDLESMEIQVLEATNAINSYLQAQNLTSLNWYDLYLITGEFDSDIIITRPDENIPQLSLKQRNELTALMRQKKIAGRNYENLNDQILDTTYLPEKRVRLINKAYEAENSSIVASALFTPLGIFIGLVLALIWILLEDWWKHSADLKPIETK